MSDANNDDQVELECVPCQYANGAAEPRDEERVRVRVSGEADLMQLRDAVAAQLPPKTTGFGPWRETVYVKGEEITFFLKAGVRVPKGCEPADEGEEEGPVLAPLRGGSAATAATAADATGDRRVFYATEGSYGCELISCLCNIWSCCGLCISGGIVVFCCCKGAAEKKKEEDEKKARREKAEAEWNGGKSKEKHLVEPGT